MTVPVNTPAYSDALIVLGTAGILVPIVRRWGINPVLGYLAAGALLGPFGLGLLAKSLPALSWFSIADVRNVSGIAELGVVFLLFVIGLELSLERLASIRRLVIGLGGLQILLTTALIAAVAVFCGQTLSVALILGASLSLSSTAVVLEILREQKRLSSLVGRTSFAVLLAQDIAVLPLLLFIGLLQSASNGSAVRDLLLALLEAGAGIAALIFVGRKLMRPLFRGVAGAHSPDLFIAAVFFVIVGSGLAAHQFGLSMALGGFIAGLLLAETEYRKAVQAIVEPFKSLLLGIFFFTIGMKIDVRELLRHPLALIGLVVGVIVLKSLVFTLLGRMFRLSWHVSLESSLLLGPCGEFAFISIGLAETLGLIGSRPATLILTATAATMALLPLLSGFARRLPSGDAARGFPAEPRAVRRHPTPFAIVIGYGRVGEVVCTLLRHHGVSCLAIDKDPITVARAQHHAHEVYYGDAASLGFLTACGLDEASGLIITVGDPDAIDSIVALVRAARPGLHILSRARDLLHVQHLYAIGVNEVVHETIEASLQLAESALIQFGIPGEAAAASIHETRIKFRGDLRSAAGTGLHAGGGIPPAGSDPRAGPPAAAASVTSSRPPP
jgi:CPA2 family monovalent cation:H+ antiporter-2